MEKQISTITDSKVDRISDIGERLMEKNWRAIHDYFRISEKPEGLENFLQENGFG